MEQQLSTAEAIDLLTAEIEAKQKFIRELRGDVLEDSDPRSPLYSSLADGLRGAAPIAIAPAHRSLITRFYDAADRKYEALDRGQTHRLPLLNYALEVLGAEVQQALLKEREQMRNYDLFGALQRSFQTTI